MRRATQGLRQRSLDSFLTRPSVPTAGADPLRPSSTSARPAGGRPHRHEHSPTARVQKRIRSRSPKTATQRVLNPSGDAHPHHAPSEGLSSPAGGDRGSYTAHAATSAASPVPTGTSLSPSEAVGMREVTATLPYGCHSVVLPWSSQNVCKGEGGQLCNAWNIIAQVLREDATCSTAQLCDLLQTLLLHEPAVRTSSTSTFAALAATVDGVLTQEERAHFFARVLPWMKQVVCDAPEVFHRTHIPLLLQGSSECVVLAHAEVRVLMCCAFFSLFPGRSLVSGARRSSASHRGSGGKSRHGAPHLPFGISERLAPVNFDSLFRQHLTQDGRPDTTGKIRCLLQYFFATYAAAGDPASHTAVEITRVCHAQGVDMQHSKQPLQPVEMRTEGLIEDDTYAMQMDFANKVIGGGVLGRGCVQEEIRFVISPELLLTRLLCETLCETEVILVSGCAQFSAYTGYASTFRFARPVDPSLVKDPGSGADGEAVIPLRHVAVRTVGSGRTALALRDVCVAVVDAVNFWGYGRHPEEQYDPRWVAREAVKAYVAFRGPEPGMATLTSARSGPIATGNWGCGAFGGDVALKLVLQWCAASEAGRTLHYYVFDRTELPAAFAPVQARLLREQWSVGQVMAAVLQYGRYRRDLLSRATAAEGTSSSPVGLLDFLSEVAAHDIKP